MWGSASPSQSQTNQANAYSRKNPSRWHILLKKILRLFTFVTLPLEILEKTKLHPWKFYNILLHLLEIPMPSKNQDLWKFLINFFITSGNSTSFLLKPCNFPVLFLHSIPLTILCPQHTLLFGFFLEWPNNWTVCSCVIHSKISLRSLYLARYFKIGIIWVCAKWTYCNFVNMWLWVN